VLSECFLISQDIWSLGGGAIYLNPYVLVDYKQASRIQREILFPLYTWLVSYPIYLLEANFYHQDERYTSDEHCDKQLQCAELPTCEYLPPLEIGCTGYPDKYHRFL
jgi:hypothetical protein